MVSLKNYTAFAGHHWEWGSIANALQHQGVTMPHTGDLISPALLFGINGGITFGYFFFHYKDYDPQINTVTYNTFNGFERMLDRLGIVREVRQTTSADKGVKNLLDALENGEAPIVWADMYCLPYNSLTYDEGWWGMMPIVVYEYNETSGSVQIADRADVPLTVTVDELAKARARVKKDKFRLMTLEAPNMDKLQSAVQKGLWDCIKLYTEKPPKGAKKNFGFEAYKHLAKMLTAHSQKSSWMKLLPDNASLYAGLTSAHYFTQEFGMVAGDAGHRRLFADFLDEAALIIEQPALNELAEDFRQIGAEWVKIGDYLLPDSHLLLKETRELTRRKQELFITQGQQALDEIRKINERLQTIKTEFAINQDERDNVQAALAEQVMKIHDMELDAVNQLTGIMS